MILSLSMRALPRLLQGHTYSSAAPLTTAAAAAAASDDSSPAPSFAGYSKKYWTTVADHERQEKNFQQAVKQWRGQHYHEGLHPDMKHFLHSRKPWDAGFRLQFIKWLNLRDELKGDLSNREVAVLAGKLTTLADRPLLDRFWAEYDRRGLERHVVVENMRVNSLVETGLLPQAFEYALTLKSSGLYGFSVSLFLFLSFSLSLSLFPQLISPFLFQRFNIRTETTLLKGLVKEHEVLLNAKADAPQIDAVFAKAEAFAIELQEKWGKSAEYDAAIPNLALVLYTNNGLRSEERR